MFCGICANLLKTVCSSTMGHLIVRNDESKFYYSHKFIPLFISQATDDLDGKDTDCHIRRNISKANGKVMWSD